LLLEKAQRESVDLKNVHPCDLTVEHAESHVQPVNNTAVAQSSSDASESTLVICLLLFFLFTLDRYVCRGSLKIKIVKNSVQIISPCSQGLARCYVTRQRCSIAPAPKFSGTEKLLSFHCLRLRRSFFPDWQRVAKLTYS